MTEYYNVGKIVNTQGLKGEVRVISMTDFPEKRYQKGQILYLFLDRKAPIPLTITSHRTHKNFDILTFKDHATINMVEKYRDGILKVAAEDLTPLDEHEYYYHEIIGLTVKEISGNTLGIITEILSPGANDVWVVEGKNKKIMYLPYIESVVKKIDLTAKEVYAEIPEGLIEDED